jgi:hypothetical protein
MRVSWDHALSICIPLVIAVLRPTLVMATPADASITFTFSGPDITKTMVRITALSQDGRTLDLTEPPDSLSEEGFRNDLLAKVQNAGSGWTASSLGTNGIQILGARNPQSAIKQVDGGANDGTVKVSFDGDVNSAVIKPGDKWKVGFQPGFGPATGFAQLRLDFGTSGLFTTTIRDEPSLAALDLFNFLAASSFPDVQLFTNTNEVAFLLSPSSSPIGSILDLSVSSPGLHSSLTLPEEVPEPGTLLLWGMGAMSLLGQRAYRAFANARGGGSCRRR